jgi:hypothetical protein
MLNFSYREVIPNFNTLQFVYFYVVETYYSLIDWTEAVRYNWNKGANMKKLIFILGVVLTLSSCVTSLYNGESSNQKMSRQAELAKIERERISKENDERKEREKQERQIKLEASRKTVIEKINMAKNAGSPILIYDYETRWPDSSGGIDCAVNFVNISDKRLKYIYFTVVPYNNVDDKAYSTIGNTSDVTLDHTGYIEKNNIDNFVRLPLIRPRWSNVWYNNNIRYMKIVKIEVVFDDNNRIVMDGNMINSSFLSSEGKPDSDIWQLFDDGR